MMPSRWAVDDGAARQGRSPAMAPLAEALTTNAQPAAGAACSTAPYRGCLDRVIIPAGTRTRSTPVLWARAMMAGRIRGSESDASGCRRRPARSTASPGPPENLGNEQGAKKAGGRPREVDREAFWCELAGIGSTKKACPGPGQAGRSACSNGSSTNTMSTRTRVTSRITRPHVVKPLEGWMKTQLFTTFILTDQRRLAII